MTMLNAPLNAFCADSDAYLAGATTGPLAGLTFAAKDIFDVAGHVTGCGNPHWKATHGPATSTAWVVQTLVDAGATMTGKTITDELTRGIFGENMHYGTPRNPRAPGRVPGGSSSGSASAVAGKLVDFALGSDTGGSVRVPASFCGLYGLRPTHGRIPLDGMLLQAPSYDTIGWFARDAETFARVGAVILPSATETARPRRLVIAEDAFELAEPEVREALESAIDAVAAMFDSRTTERLSPTSLEEWSGHQQILQSREAWLSIRDWLDAVNPTMSFEVSDRYVTARAVTDEQVADAQVRPRFHHLAHERGFPGRGNRRLPAHHCRPRAATGSGRVRPPHPAPAQQRANVDSRQHRPPAAQPAPGRGGRPAHRPVPARRPPRRRATDSVGSGNRAG